MRRTIPANQRARDPASPSVATGILQTLTRPISFGLNLVHVPIISSFSCAAYVGLRGHTDAMAAGVAVSIATILISLMAGYAFYRLVDAPAVRISKLLTKRAPATTPQGGRESALRPAISEE